MERSEEKYTIISVDPGKMSGLAYWDPCSPIRPSFTSWQVPTWDAIAWVEKYLTYAKIDAVVCENYIITMQTLKKTRGENWSLESIGALRYITSKFGVKYVLQTPGDAKRFATDERLKQIDWYVSTPGGHANDAARHLLLYLANEKRLAEVGL